MKKQYAAGTDSGSSCEKMIVTGPEQEALRQDSGPKVDTVIFDIGGVLVELGRFRFLEKKGFTGELAQRVMQATMRSEDWVQLDLNILSEDQILRSFIRNDPEISGIYRNKKRGIKS